MARPLIDWHLPEKKVFTEMNLGNTGFTALVTAVNKPEGVDTLDWATALAFLKRFQETIDRIRAETRTYMGETVDCINYTLRAFGYVQLGIIKTDGFSARCWLAQARSGGVHAILAPTWERLPWFTANEKGSYEHYATLSSSVARAA